MIEWTQLAQPEERARRERRLERALSGLVAAIEGGLREEKVQVLSDLGLSVTWLGNRWGLTYLDPVARPIAEQVARNAPPALGVIAGLPALGTNEAFERVRAVTGVDLRTSRVRVGITRGHLLQVVVTVPLDVEESSETLLDAAESFVELLLGQARADDWVLSVDVDRSARRKGLMVFQDAAQSAPTHPIDRACWLLERGIASIEAQQPDSKEGDALHWTALEMSPSHNGLQPERRFASTTYPEALKAVLEGLPFSSLRFDPWGRSFAWLSWEASATGEERLSAVEEVLEWLEGTFDGVEVAGTGYGPRRNYIDLWLPADIEVFRSLGRGTASLVQTDVEGGLYDTKWQDHVLYFAAG